ncbi:MAG TPA: DUF1501 domain-containing protein [Planctomycetaceae bacterium]|nr:DUF1501 domain-containing protein [Planctomycetaceae bacterium]
MTTSQDHTKNCAGISRRNSLKLGLGGMLGLGFADALRLRSEAAESAGQRYAKAKSCILIWLDGGPTHYETFDPKPDAPQEIRGEFHTIPTKVPGAHFSQHLTKLAAISDQFAVIRSICHNQGNHGAGNHYMMTGAPPRIPVGCGAFVSFHPSFGSTVAYERGPQRGIPPYFSIPSMTRSGGPSFLGAQYAPFVVPDNPNSSSFRVRDVALPKELAEERFAQRRSLRDSVDRLLRIQEKAAADPSLTLDEYYHQSFDLMSSTEAQKAFDMNQEPDAVRDRYGRNTFGQRALLARRLVEAGVPFITLNEGGWDHHTNLFTSFNKRMPEVDNTVATLIDDLRERGLLDETLVLLLGEFGRTPKINKDAGRDHWSNAMSVLMAGGGTPGGLVLGATDRKGYSAVDRVLSPENFASTIYTKMGIDPNKMYFTPQGRPTHLVSDKTPIDELLS